MTGRALQISFHSMELVLAVYQAMRGLGATADTEPTREMLDAGSAAEEAWRRKHQLPIPYYGFAVGTAPKPVNGKIAIGTDDSVIAFWHLALQLKMERRLHPGASWIDPKARLKSPRSVGGSVLLGPQESVMLEVDEVKPS